MVLGDASGEPRFLLITQNIGHLNVKVEESDERRSSKSIRVEGGSAAHNHKDVVELTEQTKAVLEQLVADLRRWILFLCGELHRKRLAESESLRAGEEEGPASPPLADVIVIHFQEVGGKTLCQPVNNALHSLLSKDLLPEAGWNSGLMIDDTEPKRFTALGSIIFVSKRLCPITSMLSIPHKTYVALRDDPCTYGGSVTNMFHAGRFKRARNSRKGFLITSIRLGTSCIAFCNCHLFHDELNTEAVSQTPSRYFNLRKEAFIEVGRECSSIVGARDSLFIFGDFNTRLDGKSLVDYVKKEHRMDVVPSPKSLTCPAGFWDLFQDRKKTKEIQKRFDIEPQLLMNALESECSISLGELPVLFLPTFKVMEMKKPAPLQLVGCVREYCRARLPAWCDRVLLNPPALKLATCSLTSGSNKSRKKQSTETEKKSSLYSTLSLACSDHDGVYLAF